MVEVGLKIRELREEKKMTQKELAELLNVTPQAVSKWENNKSYPDLDTLIKLSKHFKVSADQLLGNKKESFFESLFSKNKGEIDMETGKKVYPKGEVLTLKKVDNLVSALKLTFSNGEIRFIKSHLSQDIVDAYSLKKGKGKRGMAMMYANTSWIGGAGTFEIKLTGELVLNGTDIYSPEELWYDSKKTIQEL